MDVFISVFHSIPLIYMYISMPVSQCFYCCCVLRSEIGKSEPPTLIFEIVLALWGPLKFHMNVRISLCISSQRPSGIFTGITLNLQIALCTIAILTILSLSITMGCLHIIQVFFHFFQPCCMIFSVQSCTLIKSIPKYFIGVDII